MKREELRTGRIADSEFQFWECWESDDSVPAALERHWFRSDTGLEAPTYDHMLHMLYRQKLGLPVTPTIASQPQPSCTSEWDKRTSHTLRVRGEEVLITICEHFTEASGGAPVSTKIVGPNGLITSTLPEMLERLGIAGQNQQSAVCPPQAEHSAFGTQHSAKAKGTASGSGPQRSAASENGHNAPALVTSQSQDGNLVAPSAPDLSTAVVADGQPAMLQGSAISACDTEQSASGGSIPKQELELEVGPSRESPLLVKIDNRTEAIADSRNGNSDAEDLRRLDARDMEEAKARGEEFEKRHPWLWEDPDEGIEEPLNSMRLVWWGEYIKAVYPELAAAALDPQKYEAYIQNYDYEKPIPLNETDDEQKSGSADDAPRCQFIKADGQQCGSPALRRKRFCYFHSKTAEERKPKKTKSEDSRAAARSPLEMPVLEDDLAISMAVSNICRQLANETIDPKRATTLLYGMQVAAVAVRRAQNRAILKW